MKNAKHIAAPIALLLTAAACRTVVVNQAPAGPGASVEAPAASPTAVATTQAYGSPTVNPTAAPSAVPTTLPSSMASATPALRLRKALATCEGCTPATRSEANGALEACTDGCPALSKVDGPVRVSNALAGLTIGQPGDWLKLCKELDGKPVFATPAEHPTYRGHCHTARGPWGLPGELWFGVARNSGDIDRIEFRLDVERSENLGEFAAWIRQLAKQRLGNPTYLSQTSASWMPLSGTYFSVETNPETHDVRVWIKRAL